MQSKKSMRKAIKIILSSYGRDTVELNFDEEPTVGRALSEAGWTLSSTESSSVNGMRADADDVLENGDTLTVTGKKDGGNI